MARKLEGIDQFFDSQGVQFAPLGFGFQADWEIIERIEVTGAQATVDFDLGATGFDPTLYDEYEISILAMTNASDGNLVLRTSTDGGSTYDSDVSDYMYTTRRISNSVSVSVSTGGDDAHNNITVATALGNAAGEMFTGKIWVGPLDGAEIKTFHWQAEGRIQDTNGYAYWGGGARESATDVNGIRLFMTAGDIDGGVFVLRGRRKTPVSLISQDDWVVIDDRIFSGSTTEDFFWGDQVYDEIEITASGMTPGTDARDLLVQLSTDGSTFHAGTLYDFVRHAANTTPADSASDGTLSAAFTGILSMGTGADEIVDMHMVIRDVSGITAKKNVMWSHAGRISDGLISRGDYAGQMTDNNDSIRGVRFSAASAATFSGKVRVRGRRLTPTGVLKQDWETLGHILLTGNEANPEFTDIPINEFDEFEIALKNIGSDTSGQTIFVRFSSDNGVTYKSGATDYEYGAWNLASATAHATVQSGGDDNLRLSANFDSTSVRKLHGTLFFGPLTGGSRKHVRYLLTAINDGDDMRAQIGSGAWIGTDSDGETSAIQFGLEAGGNYTAGSEFTLRGRRKVA